MSKKKRKKRKKRMESQDDEAYIQGKDHGNDEIDSKKEDKKPYSRDEKNEKGGK